jgi:hypothetical protein
MRIDYPHLETLHAQARRERAEAVYRLILLPLKRLFRPSFHPRKSGRVAA